MIGKGRVFIVFILFAATWYVLQTTSEVTAVPIKKSLSDFPHVIGDYYLSNSFQSSAGVLKLLGVDDYIQYNYVDKVQDRVNFYAGYYGAVGVSGSYHSPKNCLPGGGWGIESVKRIVLNVGVGGKKQSTVSQMVIRNGKDLQVVLYWYQNRGRIISSEYMEKVYLVVDAILKGRRDGTFVRIMAVDTDGDLQATEKRVYQFAETVMPLLENYLPGAKL